jgi:hypothetical protein
VRVEVGNVTSSSVTTSSVSQSSPTVTSTSYSTGSTGQISGGELQSFIQAGGLNNIVPGGQVSYNIVGSSTPVSTGTSASGSSG